MGRFNSLDFVHAINDAINGTPFPKTFLVDRFTGIRPDGAEVNLGRPSLRPDGQYLMVRLDPSVFPIGAKLTSMCVHFRDGTHEVILTTDITITAYPAELSYAPTHLGYGGWTAPPIVAAGEKIIWPCRSCRKDLKDEWIGPVEWICDECEAAEILASSPTP